MSKHRLVITGDPGIWSCTCGEDRDGRGFGVMKPDGSWFSSPELSWQHHNFHAHEHPPTGEPAIEGSRFD